MEQNAVMHRLRKKSNVPDRRHDWDAPGVLEDGNLDDESSSSEDMENATRYVPTSSRSPVKLLSRSEKQKGLGVANPVLSNPSGKTVIYRKVRDRKKNKPYYKEPKEEIVRESDHIITLKSGEKICKSDLAVKITTEPRKVSPRKKYQLFKFVTRKGPRKVIKAARNVVRDKFSPQTASHDFEYSNAIGQLTNDIQDKNLNARNEFRRLQKFCKSYLCIPKCQCVKIFIRKQKIAFHLANLLIFQISKKT